MQPNEPLHAQRFVRRNVSPPWEREPRLLYCSKLMPDAAAIRTRYLHAHQDLAEVVLLFSGQGRFLLNDESLEVTAGDLLVYNAGVIHDEAANGPLGLYCVGFDGLKMPGLKENTLLPEEKGYVFPTGDRYEVLRALFEMVFRNLRKPGTETFCQHLTLSILAEALAIAGGTEPHAPLEPDVLGKRIKDYIDAHYTEPLTLGDIGDALRVSPYYLSHVFRKVYGYAPMKYLTRRRIGEAQTLLLTTDLPVGRVAEQVGYDTQTHFDAQFLKYAGVSPGRYRKAYLERDDGQR